MEFNETYTEYIYNYGEVMYVKIIGVSSVIAELLPFDFLNFNVFFCPQQ